MALELFINNERTSNSNIFYRQTSSSTSNIFTVRVADPTNIEADLSDRYVMYLRQGYYDPSFEILENDLDRNGEVIPGNPYVAPKENFEYDDLGRFSKEVNWNTTNKCVCAVFVEVEDLETGENYELSLSGYFVPHYEWPRLDFVAWPQWQIQPNGRVFYELTSENFGASDGVYFYGEGHTETITIRAISAVLATEEGVNPQDNTEPLEAAEYPTGIAVTKAIRGEFELADYDKDILNQIEESMGESEVSKRGLRTSDIIPPSTLPAGVTILSRLKYLSNLNLILLTDKTIKTGTWLPRTNLRWVKQEENAPIPYNTNYTGRNHTVKTIKWYVGHEPVTKTTYNNPGKPLITASTSAVPTDHPFLSGSGSSFVTLDYLEGNDAAAAWDSATLYSYGNKVRGNDTLNRLWFYNSSVSKTGQPVNNTEFWKELPFSVGVDNYTSTFSRTHSYSQGDIIIDRDNTNYFWKYINSFSQAGKLLTDNLYWSKYDLINGIGTFDSTKSYFINDVVIGPKRIWKSSVNSNTASLSSGNNWSNISLDSLGANTYSVSKEYTKNEIVVQSNKLYRYTSESSLKEVPVTNTAYWQEVTAAMLVTQNGSYDATKTYSENDIVIGSSDVFQCIESYETNPNITLSTSQYWKLLNLQEPLTEATYDATKTYKLSDIVLDDQDVWVYINDVNKTGTNTGGLTDGTYWRKVTFNSEREIYRSNLTYSSGEMVRSPSYKKKIWQFTQPVDPAAVNIGYPLTNSVWKEISYTDIKAPISVTYNAGTTYIKGDIVTADWSAGNQTYRRFFQYVSETPAAGKPITDIMSWRMLTIYQDGENIQDEEITFSLTKTYRDKDIVIGLDPTEYLWVYINDNPAVNQGPVENSTYWKKIGKYNSNTFTTWLSSTEYKVGDVVMDFTNQIYWKCIQQHTNQDRVNGSYWKKAAISDELTYNSNTSYLQGDFVIGSEPTKFLWQSSQNSNQGNYPKTNGTLWNKLTTVPTDSTYSAIKEYSKGDIVVGDDPTERVWLYYNDTSSTGNLLFVGSDYWRESTDEQYSSYWTAKVKVKSDAQTANIEYPISMWATNSFITTQGPYVTYDDRTGLPEYYPFFASSINSFGKEYNTPLKQNIQVRPYPVFRNAFMQSPILSAERIGLPLDFAPYPITATIGFTPLTGAFLSEKYIQTQWIVKTTSDIGGWEHDTGKLPAIYNTNTSPITGYTFDLKYDKESSQMFLNQWTASPIVDTSIMLQASAYKQVDFELYPYKGPYDRLSAYKPATTEQQSDVVLWNKELWYNVLPVPVASEKFQTIVYEPNEESVYWKKFELGIAVPEVYLTRGANPLQNDWKSRTVAVPLSLHTTINQIPYTNIYLPNYYSIKGEPTTITVGVWHPDVDEITITSPNSDDTIVIDTKEAIWNGRGTYNPVSSYEQGDVVDEPNGTKRYLYVNSTASVGKPLNDTEYWQEITVESDAPIQKGTMRFNKIGTSNLLVKAVINERFGNYVIENKPVYFQLNNMTETVERFDDDAESGLSDSKELVLTYSQEPSISPNEWVTADNVNSIFEKFYTTLNEIDSFTKNYARKTNFYAWWGLEPTEDYIPKLVWEDVFCQNLLEEQNELTWADVTSTSPLSSRYTWAFNKCGLESDPTCQGKHCLEWKWEARQSGASPVNITWKDTKDVGAFPKRWGYERCAEKTDPRSCIRDSWNVSTIDVETFPIYYSRYIPRCSFVSCGAFPDSDFLISVYPKQILLHNNDYEASKIDGVFLIDDYLPFQNIVAASYLEENMVAVLDQDIPRVAIYKANKKSRELDQVETWGIFGQRNTSGMNKPTDVHLDSLGRVFVCDNGNKCIKKYSTQGKLLLTIYIAEFEEHPPTSVCVDSDNNVHCLSNDRVYLFNEEGTLLKQYKGPDDVYDVRKITTSFNREAIYMSFKRGIAKFFKSGLFSYQVIKDIRCADESYIEEFDQMSQDKARNIYVTCQDKILKIPDLQKIIETKAKLGDQFWSLSDLLINKEEFIQPWVYLKSFHRLWDNIEILRNSLFYDAQGCKGFNEPAYKKEDLVIGQNELVTNSVINRLSEQLWKNLSTIIKFFDPNCKN